jgi:hypothetical protein
LWTEPDAMEGTRMKNTLIGILAASALMLGGCSKNADSETVAAEKGNSSASMQDPAPGRAARAGARPESTLTVPAGTLVNVRLESRLNSGRDQAGDGFTATVTEDVILDGRKAIPAGSTVFGTIESVTPAKRGAGNASMTLAFNRLRVKGGAVTPMVASLSEQTDSKKKHNAAIIGGGAAGGALLGRIIGKDTKGAVVGALVGGAVGTGVVMSKEGDQVNLPAGTEITIRIDESVKVSERA